MCYLEVLVVISSTNRIELAFLVYLFLLLLEDQPFTKWLFG